MRTFQNAQAATRNAQVLAVANVIRIHMQLPGLAESVAERVVQAVRDTSRIFPDPCPDEHPEFGSCVGDFGHSGGCYTTDYDDPRRPDGSHPWDY